MPRPLALLGATALAASIVASVVVTASADGLATSASGTKTVAAKTVNDPDSDQRHRSAWRAYPGKRDIAETTLFTISADSVARRLYFKSRFKAMTRFGKADHDRTISTDWFVSFSTNGFSYEVIHHNNFAGPFISKTHNQEDLGYPCPRGVKASFSLAEASLTFILPFSCIPAREGRTLTDVSAYVGVQNFKMGTPDFGHPIASDRTRPVSFRFR